MPIVFYTARELRLSKCVSATVAWLLIFDVMNAVQGRLILLDAQLVFYVALSLLIALKYWKRCNYYHHLAGGHSPDSSGQSTPTRQVRSGSVTGRRSSVTPGNGPVVITLSSVAAGFAKSFVPENGRMAHAEELFWSISLGLSCGAALSVKWTGIAVTTLVLAESSIALFIVQRPVPMSFRVLTLFTAAALYIALFAVHFHVLPYSGTQSPHAVAAQIVW